MASEGLMDRQRFAHSDGTTPAASVSEEEKRWFRESMRARTFDVFKRMKKIADVIDTPEDVLVAFGVTTLDIEDMLDELHEHVESIDVANDLHAVGGLVPLLRYLKSSHSSIRAKAAEVVSTIVQNNPNSQAWVMEAKGLDLLLNNFASDPDMISRTKALGALSSLIRHNPPAMTAFCTANAYVPLKDALCSENVNFQRKALNLIQHLLHEKKFDCSLATELNLLRFMTQLASSTNAEVREAALGGLMELIQCRTSSDNNPLGNEDKLKQVLENRIEDLSTMDQDDLQAAREERHLVDSLWRACYEEPSSLGEKGLLVLPGEETRKPPHDNDIQGGPPDKPLSPGTEKELLKLPSSEHKPLLLGPEKEIPKLPSSEKKPLLPGPEKEIPKLPSSEYKPLLPGRKEDTPKLPSSEKKPLLPGPEKEIPKLPSSEEKPLLPGPEKEVPKLPSSWDKPLLPGQDKPLLPSSGEEDKNDQPEESFSM